MDLIKEDKWSQFGHYLVGNSLVPLYHPKLALESNRDNQGQVKFVFHDSVYAAANPKVEPKESLLEMYVQRVRYLREKYDYIVLMYSGGADSHNVLKCFEHADAKLDEIVSFVDSSYKSRDSKISSEIYRVALPEVTEYQKKHHGCEYRLLEVRDIQQKLFNDPAFKFDSYQDMSYHIVPFSVMHHYGLNYIDKYRDLHNAGKRVCVLHGIDKLKLRSRPPENKWHFYFDDFSSMFGQKHYFRDYPIYDEFFYWTPDEPRIPIKQAHIVSKYMDYLDSIKQQTPYRTNERVNTVWRKSGTITNWEYINHIIYPFWQQGTFSMGKTSESRLTNARDDTLSRSPDEIIATYKKGVAKTLVLAKQTGYQLTPNSISNSPDTQTLIGLKSMESVSHYIE
jgi:hypothetical protein